MKLNIIDINKTMKIRTFWFLIHFFTKNSYKINKNYYKKKNFMKIII
jgi:hypothetical protein